MKTICNRFTVDGLLINVHDLNVPMSGLRDLYTAIIVTADGGPEGRSDFGLSIQPTEVTEGLSNYDLQRRIATDYFRKMVLAELNGLDIQPSYLDGLLEQLSRTVASQSEGVKRLGRMYTQDSDMFAKINIDDIWSVNIFNEVHSSIKFEDGLWGQFLCSAMPTAMFQLTHREYAYGTRVPFKHNGMVDIKHKDEMQHWLKVEFLERWGRLLSQEVVDSIEFVFDGQCLAVPLHEKRSERILSPHEYHVGEEIQMDSQRMGRVDVTVTPGPKEFLTPSSSEHQISVSVNKLNPPGGFSAEYEVGTSAERRMRKLRPGVEIQVYGAVSEITEIVPLDESTEAGTRILIMSIASDGETFLFLIGARGQDHVYATGIPVADITDILLTV
jgi:hypothetical protein